MAENVRVHSVQIISIFMFNITRLDRELKDKRYQDRLKLNNKLLEKTHKNHRNTDRLKVKGQTIAQLITKLQLILD